MFSNIWMKFVDYVLIKYSPFPHFLENDLAIKTFPEWDVLGSFLCQEFISIYDICCHITLGKKQM